MSDFGILLKTQVIDKEIYELKNMLDSVPDERQALDLAFEDEKKNLKSLEDELNQVRLKQKEREMELQEKEGNVKKLDGQLSLVKTNKEYTALQQEIVSLKADNSMLEEQIIKLMDEVDRKDKEVKSERKRLDAVSAKCNEEKALFDKKEREAKEKIVILEKQREDAIKDASPESRSLYERILKAKNGVALALVKDETCSACHMQLRPQVVNDVMSKDGNKLVVCENCSRILYLED